MKLRLHHIEMCVKDPSPVLTLLCQQFGLYLVGKRRTTQCEQFVVELGKTIFVITSRRKSTPSAILVDHENTTRTNLNYDKPPVGEKKRCEPWTVFCCDDKSSQQTHIDSVFNIAIEVKDLTKCMLRLEQLGCKVLQEPTTVLGDDGGKASVRYAIIRSCCGNLVHTLIEKRNYDDWFLPGFERVEDDVQYHHEKSSTSYFDHVTLACHMGDSNSIIKWYQDAFEMKRFINNRAETEEEGLVIGDEIGMRLKVLEFWKCSEIGLQSTCSTEEEPWEILKIIVVESLPLIKNVQVESFIRDHNGPGLQHIGLHTSTMIDTVAELVNRGVRFRYPPAAYYTEIGQLKAIQQVGVDPEHLSKYGILLDTEADVFDEESDQIDLPMNGNTCSIPISSDNKRYLMQIFTHPIFDRDTFFLEIIQRKGARGFGVGNISALARSVNHDYQAKLKECQRVKQENECPAC